MAQFIVLARRRLESFPEAQFTALLEDEAEGVRGGYAEGTVRAAWTRGDVPGAVLLLEAASLDDARAFMEALPFGRRGMLELEYVPVSGYRGFGPRG